MGFFNTLITLGSLTMDIIVSIIIGCWAVFDYRHFNDKKELDEKAIFMIVRILFTYVFILTVTSCIENIQILISSGYNVFKIITDYLFNL